MRKASGPTLRPSSKASHPCSVFQEKLILKWVPFLEAPKQATSSLPKGLVPLSRLIGNVAAALGPSSVLHPQPRLHSLVSGTFAAHTVKALSEPDAGRLQFPEGRHVPARH